MEAKELRKGSYYIYRMVPEEGGVRRLFKVRYTGELTKEGFAICIPKQGKQFKGRMDCNIRMMTIIESFHDSGEAAKVHTPGGFGV